MNDPHYLYIGNGAYCYANATSMLLSSIEEDIAPSLIEALTGVGLGAMWVHTTDKLYFNNTALLPDLGVTKALDLLGFTYETKVSDGPDDFPGIRELKRAVPFVAGPLNMGFLTYNPRHKWLLGADHFIFVYDIDEKFIYAHDPAGFPHVSLSIEKFREAWQAEGIGYKEGFYRYTFAPHRSSSPSEQKIYESALAFFKKIYEDGGTKLRGSVRGGSQAIRKYSDYVQQKGLSKEQLEHFIYFALPLGSKRASDYAKFFAPFNQQLSDLKYAQAKAFGLAHTYAVNKDWPLLAQLLIELADIEEKFKKALRES